MVLKSYNLKVLKKENNERSEANKDYTNSPANNSLKPL